MLAQVADILTMPANGVLCVQECGDGVSADELLVVATAGASRRLGNATLGARRCAHPRGPRTHRGRAPQLLRSGLRHAVLRF
ncbi:hypothetical protein LP420_00605 [Massilia sp. B-10]|nr:hypothetical protein LP420_00605 [Massilia sp. B-10]